MRRAARLSLSLVIAAAFLLTGCAQQSAAAQQKAACFANEALVSDEMRLFKADSGIDAPLKDVLSKMHISCPSGGTYSYDTTTGVVTCSVHGHP